jgi:hypothetical protein
MRPGTRATIKYTSWWISDRRSGPSQPSRPWPLSRDGKTNKAGAPKNPLLLALILREYEDEIYFVRPPLFVQRVIFGALARVAHLLGYRAEYPYPYVRRGDTSRAGM